MRLALLVAATTLLTGCASTPTDGKPAASTPGTCSLRELGADSSRVPLGRDETETAMEGAPVRIVELRKRKTSLRILDGNAKLICERSDGSMIDRVYADDAQRVLLVIAQAPGPAASKTRSATWVSLDGCKALLPPLSGASPDVDSKSAKVTFPPACEAGHSAQEAMCTAAQVFALDADCLPRFLSVESSALTEREIGVAFDGTRTIRHPRTEKAEIIH